MENNFKGTYIQLSEVHMGYDQIPKRNSFFNCEGKIFCGRLTFKESKKGNLYNRVNGRINGKEECAQTNSLTEINTFIVLYSFLSAFSHIYFDTS